MDITHELATQLDWHWEHHLRPRLDGLRDEEYRWEPVAGCWSVRPRDEATTSHAAGAAGAVVDYVFPEPEPPPVTTIAWRIAHLVVVLGARAADHFGGEPVTYESVDWPLTADGGLALLDEQYRRWIDGVRSLDAEALAAPVGSAEGPWANHSFAGLVLHINREAIHHGAEIAVLRDLHRAGLAVSDAGPGSVAGARP